MNILAFDTSSSLLSVALKSGRRPIAESRLNGFIKHAENLLPMMDRLLKKQKLNLSKIDLFLLNRGPGSFTGLRVGFSTLKGFLAGGAVACKGALSLDVIVDAVKLPEKSTLAVCLDAGRQRLFCRLYQRKTNSWKPVGKVQMLTLEETARMLPVGCALTGDALKRYAAELISAAPEKKLQVLAEKFWYPRASTLIRWELERPKSLQALKKPRDFIPRYFRLSEPEERKKNAVLHS